MLCQTGGDFDITLQTIIALKKHAFSKIHSFYSMVRIFLRLSKNRTFCRHLESDNTHSEPIFLLPDVPFSIQAVKLGNILMLVITYML